MHGPLTPPLRAEWRGIETLEAIAPEWRALADRALEPNVFYTPEFMLAAAPVFGANAGATLMWSATGQLMGLFPMAVERAPFARAAGWTHPYAPLGTPLVDRHRPETTLAAWLDHLTNDRGMPPLLLLPLIPTAGSFAATLDKVLAAGGRSQAMFGRHQRAMLAPGSEREHYVERVMSSGRRKNLRRLRQRLGEIGPVSFAQAHTAPETADALKDFLIIEASGWKGLAGTAAANDPAICRFMETMVGALAAEGRVRVDRLMLTGRAVAAAITLASGDTAWCWKIAYSEEYSRFSPGVQLMVELTGQLLAQPALARVDSCATADHPMIDHIWRERLELGDRLIALRPPTVPFAMLCGVESLRRQAIAAARTIRNRIRGH